MRAAHLAHLALSCATFLVLSLGGCQSQQSLRNPASADSRDPSALSVEDRIKALSDCLSSLVGRRERLGNQLYIVANANVDNSDGLLILHNHLRPTQTPRASGGEQHIFFLPVRDTNRQGAQLFPLGESFKLVLNDENHQHLRIMKSQRDRVTMQTYSLINDTTGVPGHMFQRSLRATRIQDLNEILEALESAMLKMIANSSARLLMRNQAAIREAGNLKGDSTAAIESRVYEIYETCQRAVSEDKKHLVAAEVKAFSASLDEIEILGTRPSSAEQGVIHEY